jgi:Short-chain dehydrogenases of various substrate specificities
VILLARRAEALKMVSDACIAVHKASGLQQGGKFTTVQMHVSDQTQIATLWDKVPQDLRTVDVLGESEDRQFMGCRTEFTIVNNAGFVLGREHVGQIADADIEAMFATNVFGLISMTQLLIKGMSHLLESHISTNIVHTSFRFQSEEIGTCN